MKKIFISLFLVMILVMSFTIPVFAATSQDVTVTGTPSFISISNSPSSFDFQTLEANVDEQTSNGYFTINNTSTVAIDINIKCNGWSGTTSWTYGAPAEDQGQLKASSANGGVGGSTGAGNFDIVLLNGSDTLLCDAVGTSTNPTWELQIDVASSFTHGAQQTSIVTITAISN